MLIDTHCHIDVEDFDHDRGAVLHACEKSGVGSVIVPGVRWADFRRQAGIVARYPLLRAAYGLHPCYMAEHRREDVDRLGEWLEAHQAVAVGETGLDFFIQPHDPDTQIRLFEAQLSVAATLQLPVILHARRSHDRVLQALKRAGVRAGIFHAWSGSEQQAKQAVDLGFCLGFGGAATGERALKLRRLLATLPAESIVIETDAPDIPPSFARGERNSPAFLPRIAAILAEVRGMPVDVFAALTSENARRVFGGSV